MLMRHDLEEAMNAAMQIRSVDVDGRSLRVGIRRGKADTPPLLIFNGVGANLELVEPFTAALEGVETVVFDVPGVGGSPLPDLPYRFSTLVRLANRLLTQLGYEGQVDALGVSWGGALAQQFAHQYPERCRRLILAATSPGAIMVPGKLSAITKLINPRRYTDPEFLEKVGADLYGGAFRREPGLLREHGRHIRPPRGLGYLYPLLAPLGWTSILWLHSLRQPTLVMAGSDDPIVPLIRQDSGRLYSQIQALRDGHLFLVTRAREVAPVVREFLAEGAGGRGGCQEIALKAACWKRQAR